MLLNPLREQFLVRALQKIEIFERLLLSLRGTLKTQLIEDFRR